MKRRPPPAPCCANSTIQRPGSSRRSSATPTASTSQPNSSSDPRPSQISTAPTRTSPGSPPNPPGQPYEPTCSTSRPKLESTHSATCRQPPAGRDLHTAGDMAAVLYWRLPELAPINPRSAALAPGHSRTLHAHPVWGAYLAKRSQLVADLADQVQDHACQGDGQPVWAAPGSHPSTALVGDIAVWRAANGINPQDPRPTGGSQLGTLPTLWKQRLDRHIARATYPPADARADEPQAGRTALSPRDDRQRPYHTLSQRPSAPSAPGR